MADAEQIKKIYLYRLDDWWRVGISAHSTFYIGYYIYQRRKGAL